MDQSLKDVIAGFVSGWTQVIIMQPFQLVKIRLQTQSTANPYYHGIGDCFKKISKQQGLLSFYKGTVTPLIGIGLQVSAMFFTYQWAKRQLRKLQADPKQRLFLGYVPLAGLLASLPTSIVASPVEHARIRIQIQKQGESQLYNGSVDAGKKILQQHGLKGLYRGFYATWARQAIGQSSYFFAYQYFLRLTIRKDQKVSEASLLASLIGGAVAGIVFWLAAYPADYVKTLLQTDELVKGKEKFKGIRDCAKQRFKAGGFRTFYKGIGVTLIRSAAVNAGGFFAFQSTSRALGRSQDH